MGSFDQLEGVEDVLSRCEIRRKGSAATVFAVFAIVMSLVIGVRAQTTRYFSQIAVNEGSETSLWVYNPSETDSATVSVNIFAADATPLHSVGANLSPNGSTRFVFGDPGKPLSTGWASIYSTMPFEATEFFDLVVGGRSLPRVGILPGDLTTSGSFFSFVDDKYNGGVALVNPNGETSTTATITLLTPTGNSLFSPVSIDLAPGSQVAAFLDEARLFGQQAAGFSGIVKVSASPLPIALTSLVQNRSTGELTSVAVTSQSAAAAGPTIVTRESQSDSVTLAPEETLEHSASCQPGEILVGGRAELEQPGGGTPGSQIDMQEARYSSVGVGEPGQQSWFARATNTFGFDRQARLTVYATCLQP